MQFEFDAKIKLNVETCNLKIVLIAFLKSLPEIFGLILGQIMIYYAKEYGKNGKMEEILGLEPGERWHWKSKEGNKPITIKTLLGKVKLPNPVVEIRKEDGSIRKMVLGRKLLEVSAYHQIPDFMKEMIGSLGGLMSFRSVGKSMKVFSLLGIGLGSIWRSLQWSASRLDLSIKTQPIQDEVFETDGTGISTLNSGKRGSEAKVFMQRKAGGGLLFLGVKVGKYNLKTDWECLLEPIKALLGAGKRLILVTDGDETPINVWNTITKGAFSLVQRCLWHIPHQLKYMLWKDKASKEQKIEILSLCYNAFRLRKNVSIEEFADYTKLKLLRIDNLLERCKHLSLTTCLTFLRNAKDLAFNLGRTANHNHNTSLTERDMRTIKQRTRYAIWSDKGVENVIKIRLNHFYNDNGDGLHFGT